MCECGCGADAGVYSATQDGHRKGEPKRFISGHNDTGGRPPEPLEARYAVKDCGYKTPCWVWQRTIGRKGYGTIWDPGRQKLARAHRFFYERFIGPIPTGLQLDHLCRIRACVNPAHLEPVTQPTNQQRGMNAKLTREQANEIRRRGLRDADGRRQGRRSGESLNALAREFGVSWPVVKGIVSGQLWPSQ